MHHDRSTRRLAAIVLLVALAGGTACAATDETTAGADDAGSTVTTMPDGPPDPDSYTEPPDDLVPDDGQFKFGQEIVIAENRFVPLQLVANVDKDITIRNESSETREVRFINGPADESSGATTTGPIPPGGTFVFHPEAQRSLTFQIADDPAFRGAVFIDIANYQP